MKFYRLGCLLGLPLALIAASLNARAGEDVDPAEIAIGERLFLETRFAQSHAVAPGRADPALADTVTTAAPLPGPFAGGTMNCRACHLVDEHADAAGMRLYADYARRPPLPAREDGETVAVRNSQAMVGSAIARDGAVLLHHDGEFADVQDLVIATLTGRNYGWLPGEQRQAVAHIARVIRADDGHGELAREFGGSYRKVLAGTASDIPDALRLPPEYRIDVTRATDDQLVAAVARLIAAYTVDLDFARDEQGRHIGSPYDRFLANNGIDRAPRAGESAAAYGRRLFAELQASREPVFVTPADGAFETHDQPFAFGAKALAGLKLFLDPAAGNCAACHVPPDFTDFALHNTGATELEYDAIHGAGAFAALAVPDLAARRADPNAALPPSEQRPAAIGRFRAVPAKNRPGHTDLGAWNTVLNPDLPRAQAALRATLCGAAGCSDEQLLARAFAAFKTPTLRDLGHSGPYLHDGSRDSIESVLAFYVTVSERARAGQLRQGAPELAGIRLAGEDLAALAALLRVLNEDYD